MDHSLLIASLAAMENDIIVGQDELELRTYSIDRAGLSLVQLVRKKYLGTTYTQHTNLYTTIR